MMARRNVKDATMYGGEPEPNSELNDLQLSIAYSWYNYNCDDSDKIKFVKEWAKDNKQTDIYNNVENVKLWKFMSMLPWASRLLCIGTTLPERTLEVFRQQIEKLKIECANFNQPTLVEKEKIQKDDVILCNIEEMIDDIIDGKDANIENFMKCNTFTIQKLNKIRNKYTPQLDELNAVGKDADITEAYKKIDKKIIKNLKLFFEGLLNTSTQDIENKKRQRKPRVKKKKSVDKIVKNVQYMHHFKELNITSVQVEKIVGKSILLAYDTEKRFIRLYVANEGGFSFKGTTLQNYNEELSVAKKIRKPTEQIPFFMTGTKKAAERTFKEIRATEAKLTGRINENIIFMRVFD